MLQFELAISNHVPIKKFKAGICPAPEAGTSVTRQLSIVTAANQPMRLVSVNVSVTRVL
jgi:hypothetical protein